MALMFSRLAHSFIKNGYYPTDEVTTSRILNALEISGYDLALHPRAGVSTTVLENDRDPQTIPLEITINEADWAAECAAHYNWAIVIESEGDK